MIPRVTVVLVTRTVTGEDADGNDLYGEPTQVSVQAVFDPGGSVETQNSTGDTVVSSPRIFLPAGSVLKAVDAVLVAGLRFEVAGDPLVWADKGVEVRLRRVSG